MAQLEVDDRGIVMSPAARAVRKIASLTIDSATPSAAGGARRSSQPPTTPLEVGSTRRLRSTDRPRVHSDRRGLLGAVVRTVPDGRARSWPRSRPGRPASSWSSKVNTDVLERSRRTASASARFRPWRFLRGGREVARTAGARPAADIEAFVGRRFLSPLTRDRASSRLRSLSLHANYACRHSGACCTAGWAIPVEADMQALLGGEHVCSPDAHGACAFFNRTARISAPCIVTTATTRLPDACFRLLRGRARRMTRSVFVTLSHCCPTAAALVVRSVSCTRPKL